MKVDRTAVTVLWEIRERLVGAKMRIARSWLGGAFLEFRFRHEARGRCRLEPPPGQHRSGKRNELDKSAASQQRQPRQV